MSGLSLLSDEGVFNPKLRSQLSNNFSDPFYFSFLFSSFSLKTEKYLFSQFVQIVNWRTHLKFPEEAKLSPEAKDLIGKLLCNVDQRLGTKGADEIKVLCGVFCSRFSDLMLVLDW